MHTCSCALEKMNELKTACTCTRAQAPKVAGMMALAIAAVVCVAVLSNQMGQEELLEMQQLHTRDVKILKSH
jgi:hypothetical protein